MSFWEAASSLPTNQVVLFAIALIVAFGFEFINGFHDTANAVTTVIYTRSMDATPAAIYSGIFNCFGVIFGGTAVAFGIVNLLPVDILVDSNTALMTVMAMLIAAVTWNLATWYIGLPVSSSHTLIGSILGVGLMYGLLNNKGFSGLNWSKVTDTALALLCSPLVGFFFSYLMLITLKYFVRQPKLYVPPEGDDRPPSWIRYTLIGTCGGVSFAHGANDGQKGMGLLLLVLIGFLPFHFSLNLHEGDDAVAITKAMQAAKAEAKEQKDIDLIDKVIQELEGIKSLKEVPAEKRWELRTALHKLSKTKLFSETDKKIVVSSIEYVPRWVVYGTALALGLGTMVGYKRIVITVAEKIGKTHLTYAQGASAETVTAITVLAAAIYALPVSTTQTLSSGVAGTMVANDSGVQSATVKKILLAWVFTLPCTMILSGTLYAIGKQLF
jgi:inorganic phosphate transporter, PiT family